MAVADFLLEIKGPDLKGESQDHQFKDSIEISSWSWGGTNVSQHGFGSGGGTGKATIGDLMLQKFVDKTSPTLFAKLMSGEHFQEAILHIRKTAGETPIEYLKITMKRVTVTSLQMGGQGAANNLIHESFSLGYEEVKQEYITQNPDGTKGSTVQAGWNLALNKKAA
jgi:type VI secretion system secreted protein Hcp